MTPDPFAFAFKSGVVATMAALLSFFILLDGLVKSRAVPPIVVFEQFPPSAAALLSFLSGCIGSLFKALCVLDTIQRKPIPTNASSRVRRLSANSRPQASVGCRIDGGQGAGIANARGGFV
jgi:hypothetical protein